MPVRSSIAAVLAAFALAGDWITTSSGTRVCQLRYDLSSGMTLYPGFCENWQPPFQPPAYAAPYPVREGWIRSNWPAQPGIQLHVEGKGWVP